MPGWLIGDMRRLPRCFLCQLTALLLAAGPARGRAAPKVLFTFGREDDLDRKAVRPLVASLSRLQEPEDALHRARDRTCPAIPAPWSSW